MGQINGKTTLFAGPARGAVYLAAGLLLAGWLLNTPEGLLGKADAIGYAVCHRIDLRSFHLGDRQIPLCARCSGMYLGAVLGLVYQWRTAPRRGGMPPRRLWPLLILFVLAFAFDGVNSYLQLFPGVPNLYQTQNWTRMVTGTGMGLAMAAVLYPAFNQTIWQTWDARPALEPRAMLPLLLLAVLLVGLTLSENALILYPLALIGAAGVLVILTMVYGMVVVMVLKAENRFTALEQLALPLVAGFGLGLAQIAGLDFIRYLLTGTWDGFHFG